MHDEPLARCDRLNPPGDASNGAQASGLAEKAQRAAAAVDAAHRAEQTRVMPAYYRPDQLRRRIDTIMARAADEVWELISPILDGTDEYLEKLRRERDTARSERDTARSERDQAHGLNDELNLAWHELATERNSLRTHVANVEQRLSESRCELERTKLNLEHAMNRRAEAEHELNWPHAVEVPGDTEKQRRRKLPFWKS